MLWHIMLCINYLVESNVINLFKYLRNDFKRSAFPCRAISDFLHSQAEKPLVVLLPEYGQYHKTMSSVSHQRIRVSCQDYFYLIHLQLKTADRGIRLIIYCALKFDFCQFVLYLQKELPRNLLHKSFARQCPNCKRKHISHPHFGRIC